MGDSTAFNPGWQPHRLTDLAHYHNGVAFKPSDWSMDGLPIIRIEQLNNPNGEFDRYTGPVSEVNRIRDGDLVFSWSATLKVVIWRYGDGVLNQHLFKVVPKSGFDVRFIYFLLDQNMEALGSGSHGSTMKHIKRRELDRFIARVPTLAKQRKVAAILTSLDNAIESTEALIEKHQQIKTGLMHDLLARGLLPDGRLRPDRFEEGTHYAETPIGWLPRSWQVMPLIDCLNGPPKNGFSPREVETFEGVQVLGLGCLTHSGYEPRHLKHAPRARSLASGALLQDGDFLISRANTPDLVGLCGVFRDDGIPTIYPDLMMRLDPKANVDRRFLEAQLLSRTARRRLTALAVGTSNSMAKLNSRSVSRFPIALPPIEEQRSICDRLAPVVRYIRSLQEALGKLRREKLGLMQDLLTGKVPVPVHPPDPAHA